jgi:hypothetical protein
MKKITVITIFISALQYSTIAPLQKYSIETNDEKISCTLQPFTQHQTSLLLGVSLFDHYINNKQHPIHKASDNFIAIKACITNNSQETISIKKDSYIKGEGDFFSNKSEILNLYQNTLNTRSFIIPPIITFIINIFAPTGLSFNLIIASITLQNYLTVINSKKEIKLHKRITGAIPDKDGNIHILPNSTFIDFLFTEAKSNPKEFNDRNFKLKTKIEPSSKAKL